ncbi:MAG: cell division protein FtsL [Burkholderiaceae bacterium]
MVKLNVALASVLILCALLLVTSQHRARKAFIDLERAQSLARRHDVEWKRLQLEQTQLAKHSRVDSMARSGLRMQSVTPDRTLYLPTTGGGH